VGRPLLLPLSGYGHETQLRQTYLDRFKEYPDYMAQETYAEVFSESRIERARSTDPQKVIKAIESEPLAWETPRGWKIMRKRITLLWRMFGVKPCSVTSMVSRFSRICRPYGGTDLQNPEELKAVRDSYEKRMKEAKK